MNFIDGVLFLLMVYVVYFGVQLMVEVYSNSIEKRGN